MHHTYPYCASQPSRLRLRVKRPVLTGLALVCLMLMHPLAANELNAEQPGSASNATLVLSNDQTRLEAVQLDATIDVSITGLLAQMTLTQSFKNTTDLWMQAHYLFPLPEGAAVQGLMITTGDRTIHGKIMPRQKARDTFETARDTGQITGLVEQQRPNLFTMDVATVAPQSEIDITLTVMLPVSLDESSRWITLPTTHTPRYSNSQTPHANQVSGVFTDKTQSRGPRLTLTARISALADHTVVGSDTHNLKLDIDGVSLTNIPMDRDVTIRWPNAYGELASSEIHISDHANERYAQILLNPPALFAKENKVPRELLIVVDKSGSMAGESIMAARSALQFAINSLDAGDMFNIIAFDDASYPLFQQSREANTQNLQRAQRFLRELDADGGTQMRDSLQFALRQNPDTQNSHLKQVIFLTDGSVDYEEILLQDIKQQLGDARLFTIGIGSAPNRWFLEKAAEAGRGVALNIPDSTAAADAIETLLTRLVSPVVTDISVQFIGGRGELYPNPAPDLYVDRPQMLVARLGKDVTTVLVTGNSHDNGEAVFWQQRLNINPAPSTSLAIPETKLFWTRLKVASLLDEQRNAIDPELHKATITQLAINAQLLTPYTSFVAVDETPVRSPQEAMHSSEVASLIPHGNQMMSLAMPHGAAGIDTLMWFSVLMTIAGILMILYSQRVRLA